MFVIVVLLYYIIDIVEIENSFSNFLCFSFLFTFSSVKNRVVKSCKTILFTKSFQSFLLVYLYAIQFFFCYMCNWYNQTLFDETYYYLCKHTNKSENLKC